MFVLWVFDRIDNRRDPLHEGVKELLFCSQGGQVIRIASADVPQLSRATQGVRLMRLADGDTLATVATV